MIGTTLKNRYKITDSLGKGGIGETFIAQDLDRPGQPLCVVKRLQPEIHKNESIAQIERLFNLEAEILSQLGDNHPQIPKLYAYLAQETWFGLGKTHFFIVQEYIKGTTFTAYLRQVKRLNEKQLVSFLVDVLGILDFVHKYQFQNEHGENVEGVIHRDIKPDNIMIRDDGRLFLIDFGIVKTIRKKTLIPNKKTTTEMITISVGTPGYMPSEQALGKPKLSSDVYALGMTAIQALTGKLPTELPEDKYEEIIWRNLVNISDDLAAILTKMVRFRSGDRYDNAGDVLQALNQAFPIIAGDYLIKLQKAQSDYPQLEQLLAAKKWKEADQETTKIMLKIMNGSWTFPCDFRKFPPDKLKNLDSLWVHHSNGHFGFSVQKEIFTSAPVNGKVREYLDYETWCKFIDIVGWRKDGSWLLYSQLSFTIPSNKGHLPFMVWLCVVGIGWGLDNPFSSLVYKL
ncbi:MAG TPA: serine/threonine-protein kinase [Allocoleopsis sp.]